MEIFNQFYILPINRNQMMSIGNPCSLSFLSVDFDSIAWVPTTSVMMNKIIATATPIKLKMISGKIHMVEFYFIIEKYEKFNGKNQL